MTNELIEAAVDYLYRGLSVIALTGKAPNGKVHPHGLKEAFSGKYDHSAHWGYEYDAPGCTSCRVDDAFKHADTTGIGILTGPVYYVVDIDGEEGAEQWRDLVGYGEYIPDRWVSSTGRGIHLWVASIEAWPTAKLGPKLDFKGVGGYVAAPPSLHPSGTRYEWLLEPGDLYPMEMPEPLLVELQSRKFDRERTMLDKKVRKQHRNTFDPASGVFLPNTTSFDGIIQKVKDEPEGNRNGVLYWAARSLADEGAEPEDIENLLNAAIESGLARSEARRTIRSALIAAEDDANG